MGGASGDIGIILQGGLYNTLLRALELLGLADAFGRTELPLYVLNVTYPLIDEEIRSFCAGKRAVLMIEEGQPEYIEQHLNMILHQSDLQTRVIGKGVLPRAGEYTGQVLERGVEAVRSLLAIMKAGSPSRPGWWRMLGWPGGCGCGRGHGCGHRRAAHAPAASRAIQGSASARRSFAHAAGGVLHGLSRAAHFHGDEAVAT